jgi:hypothetical protein
VEALAYPSMAQFDSEGFGRQDDPSSGGSDGQLIAVGIAPVGRSDQLVVAEAVMFMIDECVGFSAYAQSNGGRKISFGVDVAVCVRNRGSDRFRGEVDGAGRVMSCSGSALKVRRELHVVRHQHRGAYA